MINPKLETNQFLPEIDEEITDAQQWLENQEEYNTKEKRVEVESLVIDKKGLEGSLNLSDFVNLKRLNCNNNNLTSLDVSNCLELTSIRAEVNQLTNDTLLLPIKKDNLVFLSVRVNKLEGDLSFFDSFTNLEELWIAYNNFSGSLKPLQKLTKLKDLDIDNTNIDSGLEYLSDSLEKIWCEGCGKLKEQLNSYSEKDEANYGNNATYKFYDIPKWRGDVKNKVANSIPVGKLSDIRSDIKKFFDKWKDKRIADLKTPQQLKIYKIVIGGSQWTNRFISVAGGALLLVGTDSESSYFTQTGGVIAIVAPFVEVVTSQWKEKYYDKKIRDWEKFVEDSENLWDDCHDLSEVIKPIKSLSFLGKLDIELKKLQVKTSKFLREYDKDNDGEIDTLEREIGKGHFPQQLRDDWGKRKKNLQEMEKVARKLQNEVLKQRQGLSEIEVEENKESIQQYQASIEIPIDK